MVSSRLSIEFATKVYSLLVIIVALWCILILLAPFLLSLGGIGTDISFFVYSLFSPVCHQDDARSFTLLGHYLGVCSRCSILYFAFLLGTIVYPFIKKISDVKLPSVWYLVGASVLMVADVALDITGVFKNDFWTRSLTGGILGFALVFYIVPGIINFSYEVYSFFKYKPAYPVKNEQPQ
jgi:uncharacterized membrane protein